MPNQELTNSQLLQSFNKKIDEQFEKLSEKIDKNYVNLDKKIGDINATVQQLKKENTELKDRVEVLEKRIRKKNIAIFGLKCNKNNLLADTLEILNEKLNINLSVYDISNIYILKSSHPNNPIIIEFVSYLKKVDVFKNVGKLKDTGIFIANDMSKEDRIINKILRQKLKEAKEEKKSAKIVGKNIIIDGIQYSYDQFTKNQGDNNIVSTEEVEGNNDSEGEGSGDVQARSKKPAAITRGQRRNRN